MTLIKPLRVITADDEPGVLFLLQSILCELDGVQLVGTAENAMDTIQLVKNIKPDVALIDVYFPDMVGTEMAEKLRWLKPDLYIVFVTGHQEYSLEAFRSYAYDYILKPIDKIRLKKTIQLIQQAAQAPEQHKTELSVSSQMNKSKITMRLGNEWIFVSHDEICYIEKCGRNTMLHSINGKYESTETLQYYEQQLRTDFYRSHKSFIINLRRVERIVSLPGSSYYEVVFQNYKGKALLSRERIHDLMNLLGT